MREALRIRVRKSLQDGREAALTSANPACENNEDTLISTAGTGPRRFTSHSYAQSQTPIQERITEFAGGDFIEIQIPTCQMSRGPEDIAASKNDALYVSLCIDGELTFSAGEKKQMLRAGEMALWNPKDSIDIQCEASARIVMIALSDSILQRWTCDATKLAARRFVQHDPSLGLLAQYVLTMQNLGEQIPDQRRSRILHSLIELLHYFFEDASAEHLSKYQRALLARIQHRICEDPLNSELSPNEVANEFGLSVRRLQALFAASGVSFSEFVRRERMSRATDALMSRGFSSASITEIAHRFGYFDSAHFTRTFKRYYQMSPRQYREQHASKGDY